MLVGRFPARLYTDLYLNFINVTSHNTHSFSSVSQQLLPHHSHCVCVSEGMSPSKSCTIDLSTGSLAQDAVVRQVHIHCNQINYNGSFPLSFGCRHSRGDTHRQSAPFPTCVVYQQTQTSFNMKTLLGQFELASGFTGSELCLTDCKCDAVKKKSLRKSKSQPDACLNKCFNVKPNLICLFMQY